MTAATVEAPARYQFKPGPYSSHALSNILAVALLFCRGLHAATPAGYPQRVGIYVWGELGGAAPTLAPHSGRGQGSWHLTFLLRVA